MGANGDNMGDGKQMALLEGAAAKNLQLFKMNMLFVLLLN